MDYLILKVTPRRMLMALKTREPLSKIMADDWRITPKKTRNVERALVVYNGIIVGEFNVANERSIDIVTNTLSFNLTPIKNSPLNDKEIDYKTSNRASVITSEKLNDIIVTADNKEVSTIN